MSRKVNSTLAGAATGAAAGGAIGSVLPGPGTAIGIGAGALIGGGLGFLSGSGADDAQDRLNAGYDELVGDQDAINAQLLARYQQLYGSGAYRVSPQMVADPEQVRVMDPGAVARANVGNVQMPHLGPASHAEAGIASGTVIDQGQIALSKAEQMHALQLQKDAAEGRGPSVAAALLARNVQNIRDQLASQAAGARGANRFGVARDAMYAGERAEGQAGLDAAVLRAKEMQDARSGLMGATSAMRGQDQDLAVQQAQLTDAVERQNALERGAASRTNSAADNAVMMAEAQMRLAAETGNVERQAIAEREYRAALNQRAMEMAGLDLRAQEGNATRNMGVRMANADRDLQGQVVNVGQQNIQDARGDTAYNHYITGQTNKIGLKRAKVDTRYSGDMQQYQEDQGTIRNLGNAGLTLYASKLRGQAGGNPGAA